MPTLIKHTDGRVYEVDAALYSVNPQAAIASAMPATFDWNTAHEWWERHRGIDTFRASPQVREAMDKARSAMLTKELPEVKALQEAFSQVWEEYQKGIKK